MNLEFDQDKRDKTLQKRGLDFARASEVFAGIQFTGQDTRLEYAEDRFITVGWLDTRLIVFDLDTARRGASHHQYEESK